jgi:hypothetical protein
MKRLTVFSKNFNAHLAKIALKWIIEKDYWFAGTE